MLWKGLTVPSLAGADLHGHLDGTAAAPDKTIKEGTDKRMGDFFDMGSPSLCIKMMHTSFFYFNYSTERRQKPYIELTNRSQQT
jgi:hypothetical protein